MPDEGQTTEQQCDKCKRVTVWVYIRELLGAIYSWSLKCSDCGNQRSMTLNDSPSAE